MRKKSLTALVLLLLLPALSRASGINGHEHREKLFHKDMHIGDRRSPYCDSSLKPECIRDTIEKRKMVINVDDYRDRGLGRDKGYYVGYHDFWSACENLLPNNMTWPQAVENYGQGQGDVTVLWSPAVEAFIEHKKDEPDINAKSTETGRQLNKLVDFLHQCHALITVTGHSDYTSDEFDGSGEDIHEVASSVNSQLKCRSRGPTTQDYPDCRTLSKMYDSFMYAKTAKEGVDAVRYEEEMADQQDNLHQTRMTEGTVGTEHTLGVVKEGLQKQQDITTENVALSGAQVASLTAVIEKMPTWKSLLEECRSRMDGKGEDFRRLYQMGAKVADNIPNDYNRLSEESQEILSSGGSSRGGTRIKPTTKRNCYFNMENLKSDEGNFLATILLVILKKYGKVCLMLGMQRGFVPT